jgi:hypothetical protein
MTLLDFLKALGVAVLLMVLNVAIAFGVMAIYSTFIAPGHDVAFYESAAQRIAPWSSIFVGAALFFLAMLWLAWRRQGRNGYLFAFAVVAIYAAIDLSAILAAGALTGFGAIVAASMLSKLAAAELGAWLGRRR